MTPEQRLLTALNNLWGEGYDPETDDYTSPDTSPWLKLDQEVIEEVLGQSDDTYMDKGAEVIMAAYEFVKHLKLTQNSE